MQVKCIALWHEVFGVLIVSVKFEQQDHRTSIYPGKPQIVKFEKQIVRATPERGLTCEDEQTVNQAQYAW